MHTVIIDKLDSGNTFEYYITKRFSSIAKPLYYQYLRKKCFKINGVHVQTGKEIIFENDQITFYIDDKYFDKSVQKTSLIPIVYEDQKLLVVDKPEGILSHPDGSLHESDLLTMLLKQKNVPIGTYSLVNRLDFNTSGLLLVGKDIHSTQELNDAAYKNLIHKYYHCLAVGYFDKPNAELHAYLLKDEVSALVRVSATMLPKAQEIITRYTVIKEGNGLSWLEVELITGKTHQIRAHLAFVDHPVLGDPLYGNEGINKRYGLLKQALRSYKLVFMIPDPLSPLAYLNGKVIENDDVSWLQYLKKN
ncbi:MAG: RluA family pseudouridine synthase [Candidatus Izemoplasmatales bacterium]|jgi:23S rRNA pseudouridine955/2504/2580 synthase